MRLQTLLFQDSALKAAARVSKQAKRLGNPRKGVKRESGKGQGKKDRRREGEVGEISSH